MRSFIIIYYGNTGSSWLSQAIGGAPSVLVPAFEPLEPWAWKVPDEVKLRWLRNAFSPPDTRDGPQQEAWVAGLAESPQFQGLLRETFDIVGFKMSSTAFTDDRLLLGELQSLGTRLVVLSRDNRIKHALSLYRYFEEKKSQFDRQGVRPPSKVKLRRFHRWVERSQRMHDDLMHFAAEATDRLGPESVAEVAYEEFVDDAGKAAVIDRLCAFLGIDRAEIGPGGFEKATPDDLHSAVVNYDRLRRRYRGTPFEVYFEE